MSHMINAKLSLNFYFKTTTSLLFINVFCAIYYHNTMPFVCQLVSVANQLSISIVTQIPSIPFARRAFPTIVTTQCSKKFEALSSDTTAFQIIMNRQITMARPDNNSICNKIFRAICYFIIWHVLAISYAKQEGCFQDTMTQILLEILHGHGK